MKTLSIFFLVFFCALSVNYLNAQTGTIYGTVLHNDKNEPIPLVNILIKGTNTGSATDFNGNYELTNLQAGSYILVASAVGHKTEEKEITLSSGERARVDFTLINSSVEVGEVLVYGASLRRERITEAPAAVSTIGIEEIRRKSTSGQIPRLLENEPGVDIAQNGLFDFNINTRGFNSSLNRRLLILLDGRDIGTAFLGATEWNGLSIPLEDLGRVELVRGPGSALYGANAYNGVINISLATPKSSPGTRISLGGGSNAAFRGEIKHSGILDQWSYRINAGAYQGKSFAVSRVNNNFEYEGLQQGLNNEVIPLNEDPVRSIYGSARVDYDFRDGGFITVEGGITEVENETIVTGIGRVQVQSATKPFGRINYNGYGLNVLLWSNGRFNIKPEKSLSTGLDLIQDALISHAELQYNFSISDFFVVVGASHRLVGIDTDGTLMLDERNDNMSSIFSQIEYKFDENIKVVGAARWDRSTLHDSRISPKLAVVWTLVPGHSLRATYNQAFQPANYSEQYLYVKRPVSPGAKRSILYQGNPNLMPEEIAGYELGYKGILSNQVFITLDFYYNNLKQFITDLGPTGSSIAEFNDPDNPNDDIVYDIWSYNNAGKVNEYGSEFSANYYFSDNWRINGNFTLFQFDVIEKGANDVLLPNTPEYKVNLGLAYTHSDGHGAEINFKYIPDFPWAAGIYRDADVKAYTVVNFAGTYLLSNLLSFNLNIVNILDSRHYEILGGSLLGRRAIITATANF